MAGPKLCRLRLKAMQRSPSCAWKWRLRCPRLLSTWMHDVLCNCSCLPVVTSQGPLIPGLRMQARCWQLHTTKPLPGVCKMH